MRCAMKGYERVYATVDLDAIRSNMEAFHKKMEGKAMLCAVVKTDGYGLGAVPAAKEVADLVWGFATATLDEAVNLRRHGISQPILVLGFVPKQQYETMIKEDIRFAAYQEDEVISLAEAAHTLGKKAVVHIKIDTGMSRIGLTPGEVLPFIRRLAAMPDIRIEGIFSHFATADSRDRSLAREQAKKFSELTDALEKEGIHIPIRHIGNSAASMDMPWTPGNMFREGIALYGYYPSEEMDKESVKLTPAMELKTVVAYVKTVPAGTPIGYGATFVTDRETRVATVSIGYGDGYPRSLSNCGEMLVHGKRARILGRVCMDQTMIDVTGIEDVRIGDTVTVIGRDGDAYLPLEEEANLAGRFNYEFLCDLGKRVPRIYIRHGQAVGAKDYFEDEYSGF